jgi:superfamily I DNA and/or RNA helicase
MKITKSELREIIREEIQQLNEDSMLVQLGYALLGVAIGSVPVVMMGLKQNFGSVSNGIKELWNSYKDDKKLKQILLKLKGDEDLKPFLKDPNKKGIRKVLTTKLSEDEMKYLNKITRNHLNQIKEN